MKLFPGKIDSLADLLVSLSELVNKHIEEDDNLSFAEGEIGEDPEAEDRYDEIFDRMSDIERDIGDLKGQIRQKIVDVFGPDFCGDAGG